VTCRPADSDALTRIAAENGVPLTRLGTTGGDRFRLTAAIDLPLRQIEETYDTGLAVALSSNLQD
jgi:hypothetical protein